MINTLLILNKPISFYQKSFVHILIREKKCVLFFIFSSPLLFCQEVKELEGVDIVEKHTELSREIQFDKNEINKLSPHDLGHLLQRVSGISMRSYGGLGGMKTISLRGLGGEHTKLLVNGLPNSNVQNGQTDFGLIQLDNIEEVSVNFGENNNLTPVSSQVFGSVVSIQTFENTFSNKQISATSSNKIGSFGQKEGFLALKKGGKSNFISASGKYRKVNGNYPYQIQMGQNQIEGIRRNNTFDEFFLNIGSGFKWRTDSLKDGQHILKVNANINGSNKELPGAVILYNDYADETLETQNYQVGGNYSFYQKSFKLRVFGVYHNKYLKYYDPSYFNLDGFINNKYSTSIINGGVNGLYSLNSFTFTVGSEIENSLLKNNRQNLGFPTRFVNNSMLKIDYDNNYVKLYGSVFNQFYSDENRSLGHRKNYNKIITHLGITSGKKVSKYFEFYTWFKQTMRPPSFNELYYTQIGNTSLQPEDAMQFNIGSTFNRTFRRTSIGIRVNAYNNYIDNKILALPTKNLFVWSITNVGKVTVFGSDFEANLIQEFNKNISIEAQGSFTYQKVTDKTDRESPTYNHQLAYTPEVTSNGSITLNIKDFSWFSSIYHVGQRYSLNQNTSSNLVDAFTLFDTSFGYQFKFKSKHKLKAQVGVKNTFDTSYSFIRYFVMPGRNYFLKLTYELN